MTEARIITLHQPWASAIALGLKKFETRSWHTDYRGTLVIHASKQPCNPDGMLWLEDEMRDIGKEKEWWRLVKEVESRDRNVFGAIVAVCQLTDCLFMTDEYPDLSVLRRDPSAFSDHINVDAVWPIEKTFGDWRKGRFAWKLENVRAIAPIPWKGAQGLRKFDLEALNLGSTQE